MSAAIHSPKVKLRKTHAAFCNEERYAGTLGPGLHLCVAPRRGFAGSFALLAFRFGAIDVRFHGGASLPYGTAHFLEHQLFKKADGDLSELFTARGAVCNAQTTHVATSYHVESVGRFEENLTTLLRLGFEAYFDDHLVDTEREIILQELASYRDHPHWVSYQLLLSSLYRKLPVREDIVGNESSLARINAAVLRRAHTLFYQPSNAGLFVSGDLDPGDVAESAATWFSQHWDGRPHSRPKCLLHAEPVHPARNKASRVMHTALPRLLVGYKDVGIPATPWGRARREMMIGLALDLMYGRGTEFFDKLYSDGVVTGGFSASYNGERDFAYAVIGGETPQHAELERRLEERLESYLAVPINEHEFERKKRKIYGRFLRNFESPEASAFIHHDAWLGGLDVFEMSKLVETLTAKEVLACARSLLRSSQRSVCLVRPRG